MQLHESKNCVKNGISLVQFFDFEESTQALTDAQQECLQLFSSLSPQEQALAISYMKGLAHKL